MRKILLLGRDGQLGWELQRSLAPLGAVTAVDRSQADLDKPDLLRKIVRERAPDVIVNAAAYTAVDKAEAEPDLAMRINANAVGVLAEEAKQSGALLVHYSTDYVFDGTKTGAYTEDDEPNPINVYGQTKLGGERAIRTTACRHLIFRTGWVYAVRGSNFAKTILRLAREREQLNVIDDQLGAPTSAELLADVTALCLVITREGDGSTLYGTYHVAPSGHTSWCQYARFLVEGATEAGARLKLLPDSIRAISSAEYASPALRPLNSRLATDKLQSAFALHMPHWQTHLRRFIAESVTADRA